MSILSPSISFVPPLALRHPVVQSALATTRTRRWWSALRRRGVAPSRPVVLECGDGVRLLALHDSPRAAGVEARGTVVLFHGWEGSARSTYLESIRPALLDDGWEVLRLNFRDHGPTHALNLGLFHSCRIDEVVGAVERIAQECRQRPLCLVGFSLGGNFALRVGLRAPSRGIPVDRIVAVNPVLDPARVLVELERRSLLFERHFVRKWRRSIRAKRRAFPHAYDFDAWLRIGGLREQTRFLVERYTEFDSLEDYLDGYCIARDRLRTLAVPSTLITAYDDPIIPVRELDDLEVPPALAIRVERYGGHCGYIRDFRMRAWIDDRIRGELDRDTDS